MLKSRKMGVNHRIMKVLIWGPLIALVACNNNKSTNNAPNNSPPPAVNCGSSRISALLTDPKTKGKTASSSGSDNLKPNKMSFTESTDSDGDLENGSAIKDLLADNCDSCHGKDSKNNDNNLVLGSTSATVKKNYDRIIKSLSSDADSPMPPDDEANQKIMLKAFKAWKANKYADKLTSGSNSGSIDSSGSTKKGCN